MRDKWKGAFPHPELLKAGSFMFDEQIGAPSMDVEEALCVDEMGMELERHLELHRRTVLDIRRFRLKDKVNLEEVEKLLNKLENRHRMAQPRGEKNE